MLSEDLSVEDARAALNSNIAREQERNHALELLETITHKARGKRFWRQFGYHELQQVDEVLKLILDEKEQEEETLKEQEEARKILLKKFEEMAYEEGFDLQDVLTDRPIGTPILPLKKKKNRTCRYLYLVTDFGQDFYWTGRGTIPFIFQYHMLRYGRTREDFLLDEPVSKPLGYKLPKIPEPHLTLIKEFLEHQ